MQRYLSIVLNESCTTSKTLISKENYELDKYIIKNFYNSEQVREYFKKEINSFIENNSHLITSIERNTGKKYRGQIVILQSREDGTLKRIKVLYKDDIKNIKNNYISNQEFMKQFIYNYKKYFSEYIIDKTKYTLSDSTYKRLMTEWQKQAEDSESIYEIYRDILKFSETKKNILKSQQKENIVEQPNNQYCQTNFQIEDDDKYDPDWDFHPDLDDIARGKYIEEDVTIQYNEDDDDNEIIKTKTKTKTLNNPNQLSFFD